MISTLKTNVLAAESGIDFGTAKPRVWTKICSSASLKVYARGQRLPESSGRKEQLRSS